MLLESPNVAPNTHLSYPPHIKHFIFVLFVMNSCSCRPFCINYGDLVDDYFHLFTLVVHGILLLFLFLVSLYLNTNNFNNKVGPITLYVIINVLDNQ